MQNISFSAYNHFNSSCLKRWWQALDPVLFTGFFALMFFGVILTASASPAVARRIGVSQSFLSLEWWFVGKYLIYLGVSLFILFTTAMLEPKIIKRISMIGLIICFLLMILIPFLGDEIKGAKRWIFGIQPSEFLKPFFIICSAWLFSLHKRYYPILSHSLIISILSLLAVIILLMIQPDFGQTILISALWGIMFFTSSVNILWFICIIGLSIVLLIIGYSVLPHVKNRIDSFLSPENFDKFGVNYQSEIASKAFYSGGILGRGPGEGEKNNPISSPATA